MPSQDSPEDLAWAIQPLRDAGLDSEQIDTHLDRLLFENIIGSTRLHVERLFGDQPAHVQAAWTEAARRINLLE